MILFTVRVAITGTGANAHLVTDPVAEHCALTPKVRGLHGYGVDADGSCLSTQAEAAIHAVKQVVTSYWCQVQAWRDEHCGCPECQTGLDTAPLFDLLGDSELIE